MTFSKELEELKQGANYRVLKHPYRDGKYLSYGGIRMLNLSSNDYLGIAAEIAEAKADRGGTKSSLQNDFLKNQENLSSLFTSSSSRLLTGNFLEHDALERELSYDYKRGAAILFNSGYHANSGILPALTTDKDLILSDKLVHASLVDALRLSRAKSIRFKHNNFEQVEQLLLSKGKDYEKIFIVVESIYSMDGDTSDLKRLIAIKKKYPNILLYVDEAHAVGVRGERGLGLCEELGVIQDIDIIIGTFGKALAAFGAYAICEKEIKELLINKMRPFIFTTAIPPINAAWASFIFERVKEMKERREHLFNISTTLREGLNKIIKGLSNEQSKFIRLVEEGSTHIVPVILGESSKAIEFADYMQKNGFFVLPIRPPTVPKGESRVRISLTADISFDEIKKFLFYFNSFLKGESVERIREGETS